MIGDADDTQIIMEEKDKNCPEGNKFIPQQMSPVAKTVEHFQEKNDEAQIMTNEHLETFLPIKVAEFPSRSKSSLTRILLMHKKEVIMLVTMSILWPSCDVFSDLMLTIDLLVRGEIHYAVCMLLPQVKITIYKS